MRLAPGGNHHTHAAFRENQASSISNLPTGKHAPRRNLIKENDRPGALPLHWNNAPVVIRQSFRSGRFHSAAHVEVNRNAGAACNVSNASSTCKARWKRTWCRAVPRCDAAASARPLHSTHRPAVRHSTAGHARATTAAALVANSAASKLALSPKHISKHRLQEHTLAPAPQTDPEQAATR